MSKKQLYLPLVLAVVLCLGIFLGTKINSGYRSDSLLTKLRPGTKLNEILSYIENEYVDTIDIVQLEEKAIQTLLQELDPHSMYIAPQNLAEMNEPLEGNFEGVGIEFRIQKDTVTVINTINGGPSAKVGLMAGDRIVKVDTTNIAGVGISNKKIISLLRGEKGTEVTVGIQRKRYYSLLTYVITRDKIPIYSVDAGYMLDDTTGYVKVSRFARTTYGEFQQKTQKLLQKGMKKLVLDLRGNGGGYMDAAVNIIDEFLPNGKLIVYTQGKARKKREYFATSKGRLKQVDLVILIDESSASASEIVAGAIQDNDRGTIIGRRSFGKGLVQEPSAWPDGSSLRLTIARYYTPTGRCIQKPYDEGIKKYYQDYYKRMKVGEMIHPDSTDFPDSLKFTTPQGNVVYGGGGIMPDLFVPYDTTGQTYFYAELVYKGMFRQFGFEYADSHRAELDNYSSAKELVAEFQISEELFQKFMDYSVKNGIVIHQEELKLSKEKIKNRLKTSIVGQIKGNEALYRTINSNDVVIDKAIAFKKEVQLN